VPAPAEIEHRRDGGGVRAAGPVLALLTVASTMAGGLVGLRIRHRLPAAMAFTGGVVLAVALFDVLPAAIERLHSGQEVGLWVGAGFLWFFVLGRLAVLHHRDDPAHVASHRQVGVLGAAALSFHSFQDGLGIGVAFTISLKLGLAVLLAVAAHDFADGLNTVTFVLSQQNSEQRARRWLYVDALAPVAGAITGSLLTVSSHVFGIGLAVYAGIFLVLGAGELLPQAHREPSLRRTALTIAGFALLFVVTRFAT
jgi:zinc transporter ZupT